MATFVDIVKVALSFPIYLKRYFKK